MNEVKPGPPREPDDTHIRMPWARSDGLVPRTVLRPLQEFLDTSIAGSVLLLGAVVVALLWANSPWSESYARLWETHLSLQIGDALDLDKDLRFWVNDGLMALFFLVVGLEIKREVISGELRRLRAAILPVMAAIGGMAVPALVYLAVAGGGETGRGWGIPMATDIAFALGALTLAARYAPPTLKPLLLTLAIADDIGAILVIAIFYTGGIEWGALAGAVLVVVLVVVAAREHVRAQVLYVALGVILWYLTYRAGIHPTIAGVVLGLVTPAVPLQRPKAVSAEAHRIADETEDEPDPPDADDHWWMRLAWLSREAVSPMARTEHALLPWTSFVILPLFALANAGVQLSVRSITDAATGAVGIGIFLGLVLGKPLGVALGSIAATKTGLGRLPEDVGWGDLAGMGFTAGIGFTVALFIAELAFPDGPL
ncbi:MAG TPA: Na+/H+ antiporter NhaA, partial [Actinomycetota bacterium]